MRRPVRRRRTEGGHGLRWAGVDGCLSPRTFTALLPMLILASALAPAGHEDVVAPHPDHPIREGDSAAAVMQLFEIPEGASSGMSIFSASGLLAALGLLAPLMQALVVYRLGP